MVITAMKIVEAGIYTVNKTKNGIKKSKKFKDFEDAYKYFRKDKDILDAGNITYEYKTMEIFYDFDKEKENAF